MPVRSGDGAQPSGPTSAPSATGSTAGSVLPAVARRGRVRPSARAVTTAPSSPRRQAPSGPVALTVRRRPGSTPGLEPAAGLYRHRLSGGAGQPCARLGVIVATAFVVAMLVATMTPTRRG